MNKPNKFLLIGPYITNSGIAKMNRGLLLAWQKMVGSWGNLVVWSNAPRHVDRVATQIELNKFPSMEKLLVNEPGDPDVLIYSGFPGDGGNYDLADLPGKLKILYLAWEETIFPQDKVTEINTHAHGVITISNFVTQVLKQNGVKVPIRTVNIAPDEEFFAYPPKQYPLNTTKKFKFLHVSTARQRKGIDLLLKAYFEMFSGDDDVTLVIKSYPGPDNLVNQLLGELKAQHSNPPEVLHIFQSELSETEIIDLTYSCDVAVYPTRTEGFGLPIAEAMYLKKPTITTGYSGVTDFANEDNAWLLDYEIVDAINSEAANLGAKWAEPDYEQLKQYMRALYEAKPQDLIAKTEHAHQTISQFRWHTAATQVQEFISELWQFQELKQQSIAVISPMNTVTGIAEYSRDLYSNIENSFQQFHYLANTDVADRTRDDSENILRTWEIGTQNFESTITKLNELQPDIIHIQLHPHELPPQNLEQMFAGLNYEPKTFLTPHIVKASGIDLGDHVEVLSKFTGIFVHKQDDLDYLSDKGLTNINLFSHPWSVYPQRSRARLRQKLGLEPAAPVIITHGLFSYHKGLLETADAVAQLKQTYPDILWLAVNAVNINNTTSTATFEELQKRVKELNIEDNVRFFPDFLDANTLMLLIQTADVGVLAYTEVGESASGAIRKFLASGTPTIVTDIPIMSELNNEVYKIPSNKPADIVGGIEKLWQDKNLAENISAGALVMSQENSWDVAAVETLKEFAKK